MKVYTSEAKSLDDALEKIQKENNIFLSDFLYKKDIKKSILLKNETIVINAYLKEDLLNLSVDYLHKIASGLNSEIKCEILEENERCIIRIFSKNNAVLIGKNGQTIKALENLVRQKIQVDTGINFKVSIDVENYRYQRDQRIIDIALKTANEVINTKITAKLDSMTSYERRLVHSALTNLVGIKTYSEGEEPNRYTVIEAE